MGGLAQDETSGDEGGALGREPPDFGADFVDMPALEHEIDPMGVGGEPPGAEDHAPDDEIQVGSGIVLEGEFGPDQVDTPDVEVEAPPPAGVTEGAEVRKRAEFRRDRPRPRPDRRKARKKVFTTGRVSLGVVILAILSALVGTARGVFDIPGLMWLQNMFYEIPPPTLEIQGRFAVGPILRYSLQLKTYEEDELGLAIEMRDALRGRDPQLLFNLSPMLIEGAVTYVLYAGPAADAVEAENLRGPLEGIFAREDPESWRPVVTPRAFYLGREGTLEEARELLASVEARGALAYILRTTYVDGTAGFEVLSGSFETAEEARWWQEDLHRKGFEDLALVDRRGSPPE
jgi:hypothetical protein